MNNIKNHSVVFLKPDSILFPSYSDNNSIKRAICIAQGF